MLARYLVFTHVAANLLWVGSIIAVAFILSQTAGSSQARGQLGLALYRRLAVPAFVVSLAAGLGQLTLSYSLYFIQTKFMHGKLLFALAFIAVHHVVGARAKRLAESEGSVSKSSPALALALIGLAVATAFFAVVKPF
jgi:putative membrane protein